MDNRQLIHDLLSIGAVKIETEDFLLGHPALSLPFIATTD